MVDTIKDISLITSILFSIYTVFKKVNSKNSEYMDFYYENVLKPFYYNCLIKDG